MKFDQHRLVSFSGLSSCTRALVIVLSGTLCVPAVAQSGMPVGIVDAPCPARQPVPPEVQAFTEDLLKPGRKLDAEYLEAGFKQPAVQAFVKAMRQQRERDWADLCRYKAENAAFKGARPRIVLIGDSITENWALADPEFFTNGIVGRGIGGQTTAQILLRFYPDVIALKPRAVHIMAGTNDLAGNTGPSTLQDYKNNIIAMIDLAHANHVNVVLAGIPPSSNLLWVRIDPRSRIHEINHWLKEISRERNLFFVDYGSVLADADGIMNEELGNDGVHPNRAGYSQMKPLAERAIAQALAD